MQQTATFTDSRVPGVRIQTGERTTTINIYEGDTLILTIEDYMGSNSSFAEGYFEALALSEPKE